jgi:GDP-4-dehydro-6-deoxy-D-mannose reductase
LKVLITGASGFVGHHLLNHLTFHTDDEIFGTRLSVNERPGLAEMPITWYEVNLCDADQVQHLLAEIRPDRIYHLAGQAFVPASFDNPWFTLETNIRGQVNLFESLLQLSLNPRILVIGSAQVYGKIEPHENPISENQPFRPDSPYSVSKIAQDMLALQYFQTHQLPVIRARPFNHIGPDQDTRFALPNFARQIAACEAGEPPVLRVGNLKAKRDFTDVRDVVRAYHLLMEKGKAGEVYNVCRGEAHAIEDLLNIMVGLSLVDLTIQLDTTRLRPVDVPLIVGDASRIRQDTAWIPTIAIEQSVADILDYARTIRTKA